MLSFLKNKWLSLRITAKVGQILLILVFACLVVASSAFLQNKRITEKVEDVANVLLPATRLSQHALTTFTEELRLYEDAIVTDEEILLQKGKKKEEDVERLLEQLNRISINLKSDDLTVVATLRKDISLYAAQAVQVYAHMIRTVDATDNEQLYDQTILLGQQAISLQNRLDLLNNNLQILLDKHLSDISKFTERQQRLGILLTLLTIGLALLISFLLTRLITRPIIGLASIARKITKGEWSSELIPVGNDEVAELTSSFRDMLTVLRQREEDLVQSEKKYREIFNATREAIIIYDAATMQIIDANQTCSTHTGYAPKEILSMKFGDMGAGIPPYNTEYARSFFMKTLAGTPQTFEWPIRKKNGKVTWAELSLTFSTLENKKVLIMVARDISERKKDEAEKQELAQQLLQADKMETLGTLAGGIAHDFNNILSGILGYTELAALRPTAGDDIKSDLKNVKKAAFRARDLVSQILAFSRKSDQEVTVFEPAIIVKEVIKLLRSSVPATIQIQQNIISNAKIQADPTQFHQIVMNLCTNALHAMEETGGNLTVALEDVSSAHEGAEASELTAVHTLCFEVTDTGIGMEDSIKSKIFDPYFTTKAIGKGTGLGLSVVHGIVKEYGGMIEVESKPEQGTTFRIFLPVVKQSAGKTVSLPRQTKNTELTFFAPEHIRIMLVDDEADLVNLMAKFFIQEGYLVCTYTDSKQALQDFSNNRTTYDMVITDMTMPRVTGLELSQKMLELCPELPIILLTGFSEQVNRDKALAIGIREFFFKPPDMQQLLLAVRSILSSR